MKNNYYLLEVEGGVERIVRRPADIDEAAMLAVGPYTEFFFWQETEDINLH